MIELPDFARSFEFENSFYLSCNPTRISKVLSHYELFKQTADVPGSIVECGVFKGASLVRFAMFRELMQHSQAKAIIGFDTFGAFPGTSYDADQAHRDRFIGAAGDQSISTEQLMTVLRHKGCEDNVILVAGDICRTVPEYVSMNDALRISLLNLDTDIYEPAVVILEQLWPRIVAGGVLIVDDYGVFPGETKAVDEYFRGRNIRIRKFPYAMTPCFIIKE